ncbi:MAG: BMP family ABC transporter substrate-binding protein [Ilumatobacteraceae bacterium]
MNKDERSGLHLPGGIGGPLSRRNALRLGAFGLGGLALGGLASACGSDSTGSSSTTGGTTAGGATTAAGGAATTAGTAAAGTSAATGGGAAKGSIKAHWVYIGPPDDNGWTQEHERGRQAAQAALGDKMESAFTPNIGFDASTTQLFEQLATDGNDVIFANTEYAALLSDVAAAHPETKFVEANGHAFTDNLFGYYLAHETAAYQLGVAAALLTKSGRIGYIGAFPTATTFNDVNGLLLGARSVNPAATVETVLVSTFFDPQKAAQAADALLSNGVELLFGVMDEPTFLQLAEKAGVWAAYWNLDFREAAPTKYVTNYDLSAFGPFYIEQCQAVLGGTWTAPSEVVLLDTPLGAWGAEVPQDVQTKVAEVATKLASGELSVYTGPLKDTSGTEVLAAGKTIDSLGAYSVDFAVEGVSGI